MNDEISILMRMTHEELEIWGALLKEWRVLFLCETIFFNHEFESWKS